MNMNALSKSEKPFQPSKFYEETKTTGNDDDDSGDGNKHHFNAKDVVPEMTWRTKMLQTNFNFLVPAEVER